ncbi:MAG TPA: DUF2268 domain-containing putative Zn-dependent protease [Bryobacteraceae bacterium]|jgi:hypothetical protein
MRILLPLFAILSPALPAQNIPAANLVTSDIDNFWRAYDAGQPGRRAEAFQKLYFDVASPGLKDFIASRITSAEELAKTVDEAPKFYASIRKTTNQVAAQRDSILRDLARFQELYPEARFPTVYFLIGRLTSGGTTGPSGLLIGTEVNALGDVVDTTELQQTRASFLRAMGTIDHLPLIVVHELVHSQQKFRGGNNLLNQSMKEGAADFVTDMVANSTINAYARDWAEAHHDGLFQQFARDWAAAPARTSGWLYNYDQVKGDQPADLGYWIGAEICRSYYERAADKNAAFATIVRMENPEAIVKGSSYAWILESRTGPN